MMEIPHANQYKFCGNCGFPIRHRSSKANSDARCTPPSYTYKMHNYSICVNVYGSYSHNQNVGKTPNNPIVF